MNGVGAALVFLLAAPVGALGAPTEATQPLRPGLGRMAASVEGIKTAAGQGDYAGASSRLGGLFENGAGGFANSTDGVVAGGGSGFTRVGPRGIPSTRLTTAASRSREVPPPARTTNGGSLPLRLAQSDPASIGIGIGIGVLGNYIYNGLGEAIDKHVNRDQTQESIDKYGGSRMDDQKSIPEREKLNRDYTVPDMRND